MTRYDDTLKLPVLFEPVTLNNILGELLSRLGLRQLRIAETEKYAHVTYFFNGGEEQCFSGEDRKLIPSPKEVATYDQKPQMSAPEVTEELLKRLESHAYDFIVLNFANPDMVGHTGKLKAAIQAAEVIDDCLKRIITKVQELGGVVLLTADHGNLEQMIDYETGAPHTAHTTNLVPCILVGRRGLSLREGGTLADVAPTVLDLMSIEKPREMTGRSLIQT
jgi:2,3-bisphosphoglycerate-independent phosphoglycerate mutase